MQDNPVKYIRGRAAWVDAPKEVRGRIHVRSSYEQAAVAVLEADTDVTAYEYERRCLLADGKWILPDFVVTRINGCHTLIEVKAAWVQALPKDHRVQTRLRQSEALALQLGWDFQVWTEKELGDALSAVA
jgi:hypothetical protein